MTETQHKSKRGRPTQGSEAKSERFGLRLTPTSKRQLDELAKFHKCSIAEVIDLATEYLYEDMKNGD